MVSFDGEHKRCNRQKYYNKRKRGGGRWLFRVGHMGKILNTLQPRSPAWHGYEVDRATHPRALPYFK